MFQRMRMKAMRLRSHTECAILPPLKMIVAVTNLGSISFVVKADNYDRPKAVDLYDKCVDMYNDEDDLKGYQKATNHFLNNCYKVGLVHEDR